MLNKIFNPNFKVNLFLHSLILFTFLSLFFTYFISKISSNAFKNEIDHQIDKLLKKILVQLKDIPAYDAIKNELPISKLLQKYSVPDKTVTEKNNRLLEHLLLANIVAWLLFLAYIYYLNVTETDFDFYEILIENIIVFAFVGLAEYYFFTRIALKFVPVAPSFISNEFLNQLKAEFAK